MKESEPDAMLSGHPGASTEVHLIISNGQKYKSPVGSLRSHASTPTGEKDISPPMSVCSSEEETELLVNLLCVSKEPPSAFQRPLTPAVPRRKLPQCPYVSKFHQSELQPLTREYPPTSGEQLAGHLPPPLGYRHMRSDELQSIAITVDHGDYDPDESKQPCFERTRNNRPQVKSIAAAFFVFLAGGMDIAWGFGYRGLVLVEPSSRTKLVWYLTAVIGAICGAVVSRRITMKQVNVISAFLIIVSGSVLVGVEYLIGAVDVARSLSGYACGLLFVPAMVATSEVSTKNMRAMNAVLVDSFSFSLGMALQMVISTIVLEDDDNRLLTADIRGKFFIAFGFLALVYAFLNIIESPISHLMRGENTEALISLYLMQNRKPVTVGTYRQLDDLKLYVSENVGLSTMQSSKRGLPALFMLCFFRWIVSASNIYMRPDSLAMVTFHPQPYDTPLPLKFICCGAMRPLAAIFTSHFLEMLGRKVPLRLSVIICAFMSLAGLSLDYFHVDITDRPVTIIIGIYTFEFCTGILSSILSAYMCEAFPLTVKPFYIGIVFVVDLVVNAINTELTLADCFIEHAILMGTLWFTLLNFSFLYLPDTRRLTLREAQAKFRQLKVYTLRFLRVGVCGGSVAIGGGDIGSEADAEAV